MNNKIQQIKTAVRIKLLDLRSIDRLVSMESFPVAYKDATEDQRGAMEKAAEAIRPEELRKLLREILKPEEMTLRELREAAADLKVKNYSSMTKDHLIAIIRASKK